MAYWLMKSEPDELSIEALGRLGEARWDGVRNYQARNFLRAMSVGDEFFFYHSSCPQPGIAGIARITRAAYPDPTALDPQSHYYDAKATPEKNPWSAVDVAHVQTLPRVLEPGLAETTSRPGRVAAGAKGSRLSVMPVTPEQWAVIVALR